MGILPTKQSTETLVCRQTPHKSYPQTTMMLFTIQSFQHAYRWITWGKESTNKQLHTWKKSVEKGESVADTTTDPLEQARGVWSDALALLHQNPALSIRDKSWLENVFPEGMWGPTIVLCVPSAAAQQTLQNELNQPLLEALREAAEQDIFPHSRLWKRRNRPNLPSRNTPTSPRATCGRNHAGAAADSGCYAAGAPQQLPTRPKQASAGS